MVLCFWDRKIDRNKCLQKPRTRITPTRQVAREWKGLSDINRIVVKRYMPSTTRA